MKIVKRSLAAVLAVAVVGSFCLMGVNAQEGKKKVVPLNDKCPISKKAINPKAVSTFEVGFC